ncbi:MAG: hypothetical protein U0487_03200 [Patescibacteria group bacterium]
MVYKKKMKTATEARKKEAEIKKLTKSEKALIMTMVTKAAR